MCVKFSNKTMSLLEEDQIKADDNSLHLDSFDGACQFAKKAPSPFSNKMFMYGKDEGGGQSNHISEEVSTGVISLKIMPLLLFLT